MVKFKTFVASAVIAIMSGWSTAALAEVVVVVSAKNPVASLTTEQAADLFLGKSNVLPGGGQAVAVDQPENSAAREEFYSKATGKNSAQIKAYWSKQIFSGKGQPPKEVGDSNGVKSFVASNPNAIGYIDRASLDATVKPVLTLK